MSDLRGVNPLTQAFLAAADELGAPANLDFNGATQDGEASIKSPRKTAAGIALLTRT